MFKHPYETTPCSSYQLKEIVSSLQRAIVNGELGTAKTLKNVPVEGLREVPPYTKAIQPFSHPLVFDHLGKQEFVVDVRPFTTATRDLEVKISNATEYQFMVLRGRLTMSWIKDGPQPMSNMGDLPARIFTRMISEGIVRRMGLSPMEQMPLAVVTAYFFFGQFVEGEIDEAQKLRLAARISRVTTAPVEKVLSIIEPLPHFKSVIDYCDSLESVVNTPRLNKFSAGMLYSIVGGSWFGAASREVVAVALEYPPYLYAMLYMALTERGYHTSYFAKLTESVAKGSTGKDFAYSLAHYLENFSNV